MIDWVAYAASPTNGKGFVAIEGLEIHKLAELEDRHWWYRERRVILGQALRRLAARGVRPTTAIDVGAAAGGNTRVLREHGWRAIALEYGAEGAALAAERGLSVVRADARRMPVASGSAGLVVAYDVLEHIDEDNLAAGEIHRVLAPGGIALIAVPSDMRLWSEHDVAVSHFRRYERDSLAELVTKAGLVIDEMASWNVLLRPAVVAYQWRRRRQAHGQGSNLDRPPTLVNSTLGAVVAAERYLPVGRLPGVSLMLSAHRPMSRRIPAQR
jgi:SAM-dependent methyltransferase